MQLYLRPSTYKRGWHRVAAEVQWPTQPGSSIGLVFSMVVLVQAVGVQAQPGKELGWGVFEGLMVAIVSWSKHTIVVGTEMLRYRSRGPSTGRQRAGVTGVGVVPGHCC